jgi:hypothetical protein
LLPNVDLLFAQFKIFTPGLNQSDVKRDRRIGGFILLVFAADWPIYFLFGSNLR